MTTKFQKPAAPSPDSPFAPDFDHVHIAKSDFSAVFAISRFGSTELWPVLLALLYIVISVTAVMLSAVLLGQLVELIINQKTFQEIFVKGGSVLFLEGLSILTFFLGRRGLALLTNEISYNLRLKLFKKLTTLPISYYDTQPLGRTITRLTSDVEGVEDFFRGTLSRLMTAIINIAIVLVSMIVTDFKFGIIIVLSSLPALFFTVSLRGKVRYWLRIYKKRTAHINARLAEFINGIPIVKTFGLEHWTFDIFKNAAFAQFSANLRLMHWNSFLRPFTMFLCSLPIAIILWIGGMRVLDGMMSIGIFVTFIRYSERFFSPIRMISQEIQMIQEALTSSERVRQMLFEPEEEQDIGPDGMLDLDIKGHISFNNVHMRYKASSIINPDKKAEDVLKGVSFDIKPGMSIGIAGETGAGKTTALNLIPRLYPFEGGDITIDGHSIKDFKRSSLRNQIGIVSQEAVIFRGTLRENLVGVTARHSSDLDRKVIDICGRSGLMGIFDHFPEGLDSKLLESGGNLSVGEKQLISFTRMLIKNPRILILDEATANIDEKCEQLIQHAITQILNDKTDRICFVIAHRLSTLLQCQKILVFKDGEIVENGNYNELIAKNGYYASLIERQVTPE